MAKTMLGSGAERGEDYDNAVAPSRLRRWAARAALAATGAALLATTEPEQFYYSFSKRMSAPSVELTSAAPSARILVVTRATALAPNGKPTTEQANATISGVISEAGAAPFVNVRVTNLNEPPAAELRILRDFHLAHGMKFGGDCTEFAAAPCQNQFIIEFERSDGGTQGGSVTIDWSIEFESRTEKDSPDEGPLDLPWTAEVSRQ
jgi:hypothetical protein